MYAACGQQWRMPQRITANLSENARTLLTAVRSHGIGSARALDR
jgi:hypothetical protein